MAFDPYDTNLWAAELGMVSVSYPRKHISTMAVMATPENIGSLSIEFEAELRYYGDSGLPYFTFWAKRKGTEQDPAEWEAELLVKPGVWIVVLNDEFRTFREPEFNNTFRINDGSEKSKHVIYPEAEQTKIHPAVGEVPPTEEVWRPQGATPELKPEIPQGNLDIKHD